MLWPYPRVLESANWLLWADSQTHDQFSFCSWSSSWRMEWGCNSCGCWSMGCGIRCVGWSFDRFRNGQKGNSKVLHAVLWHQQGTITAGCILCSWTLWDSLPDANPETVFEPGSWMSSGQTFGQPWSLCACQLRLWTHQGIQTSSLKIIWPAPEYRELAPFGRQKILWCDFKPLWSLVLLLWLELVSFCGASPKLLHFSLLFRRQSFSSAHAKQQSFVMRRCLASLWIRRILDQKCPSSGRSFESIVAAWPAVYMKRQTSWAEQQRWFAKRPFGNPFFHACMAFPRVPELDLCFRQRNEGICVQAT